MRNKLDLQVTKEISFERFNIFLRFQEHGILEGTFKYQADNSFRIRELSNGLFLEQDRCVNLVFFIEWFERANLKATTSFAGFIFDDLSICKSFKFDWLLIYEDFSSGNCYTKKGTILSTIGFDKKCEVPFPTSIFPLIHN